MNPEEEVKMASKAPTVEAQEMTGVVVTAGAALLALSWTSVVIKTAVTKILSNLPKQNLANIWQERHACQFQSSCILSYKD